MEKNKLNNVAMDSSNGTVTIDTSKVIDLNQDIIHEEISFDVNVSKVLSKEEARRVKKEARERNRALVQEQKAKMKSQAHNEMYFENEAQVRSYKFWRTVKLVVVYFFLIIAALFTLIPFYWMIITSLKTQDELTRIPATFFPEQIYFGNYGEVFTNERTSALLRYIGNTLLVATCTTCLSIVTVTLAAFAFSRLEFKGRETIFALLLATMMVPGEMLTLTNFTTVSNMDLLHGPAVYLAMILPFGTSVFYIFFLRQTFLQIPNELYYAAKVDGNSDFRYLFKVMIPIARPTIVTIIILSMLGSWNAYIWPRTVTAFDGDYRLVTDGLMTLFTSETSGNTENIMMAATTVVSIPLLLAFVFFKKYIMRGVSRSGIKG